MVAFQVSDAVLNISHGVVVVVNREDGIVVVHMDAIGGNGLQGDRRRNVPLRAHLHAKASLVDVGHDEIDELTLVGIGAGRGVQIYILAIETAIPNEVLISVIISSEAELELGRAVEVAQVEGVDALALEVALHHGVAGTG